MPPFWSLNELTSYTSSTPSFFFPFYFFGGILGGFFARFAKALVLETLMSPPTFSAGIFWRAFRFAQKVRTEGKISAGESEQAPSSFYSLKAPTFNLFPSK